MIINELSEVDSLIPHNMYFRLQLFKAFFELELEKHPRDRFIPRKHKYDIFKSHSRNIKKIGEYLMPKKETKKTKFQWNGYVNVNIPESKVSELEAFVTDDKTVFFEYNAMLMTNYQIKQYYDDYSEGIKTVAVCHDADNDNFGFALTAYAEDWYTSLAVLVYKHLSITERDWKKNSSVTVRKFG